MSRYRTLLDSLDHQAAPPRPPARIWVTSDLHDARSELPANTPDHDVAIIVGDITTDLRTSLQRIASTILAAAPRRPVVFVPGNREFWSGQTIEHLMEQGRNLARELGITLLQNEAVRTPLGGETGIVVLGSTLWTSFGLEGADKARDARAYARHLWPDSQHLTADGTLCITQQITGAHAASRAFLEDSLLSIAVQKTGAGRSGDEAIRSVRSGDPVIVATHFPPSRSCLPEAYLRTEYQGWYPAQNASDLELLMRLWGAPALWVHGHVPERVDLQLGDTRIVANPASARNHDATLILEVWTMPLSVRSTNTELLERVRSTQRPQRTVDNHRARMPIVGRPDTLLSIDIETVLCASIPADWDRTKPPKTAHNQIVCISFTEAAIEVVDGVERYRVTRCRSGGDADWTEKEIIQGFWRLFSSKSYRIVSWNGRSFDMPVILARSLVHEIPAAPFFQRGDRWANYTSRYSAEYHADVMDLISGHGAGTRMNLDEMAVAAGLPGKLGESGAAVADMMQAGEIVRIRDYCETDTLNCVGIYYRHALLSGRTDLAGYRASVDSLVAYLEREREARPHLGRFLDAWQRSAPD